MNQDQVKELLLKVKDDIEEFSLIFSGKKSQKVNGLYKTDVRQIILHNKNFTDDDELIYTAIHEFAHHIHFTQAANAPKQRCHTATFWGIFHELLDIAESKGLYQRGYRKLDVFDKLTRELKEKFITPHGQFILDLGRLLRKAADLCFEHKVRFEDYCDRELGLPRTAARLMIKISDQNLNPALGYENMKVVSRFGATQRQEAEKKMLSGYTVERLRTELPVGKKEQEGQDPLKQLEKEKLRIEKTISSLKVRLAQINAQIGASESD
jgi:hypothetical protein